MVELTKEETQNAVSFIKALFELTDWPDGGDIDGFDFQDLAKKHNLLIPEIRHSPCGEVCQCADVCSEKELEEGVECLRKAKWIL